MQTTGDCACRCDVLQPQRIVEDIKRPFNSQKPPVVALPTHRSQSISLVKSRGRPKWQAALVCACRSWPITQTGFNFMHFGCVWAGIQEMIGTPSQAEPVAQANKRKPWQKPQITDSSAMHMGQNSEKSHTLTISAARPAGCALVTTTPILLQPHRHTHTSRQHPTAIAVSTPMPHGLLQPHAHTHAAAVPCCIP
jgi:hypothetical protein